MTIHVDRVVSGPGTKSDKIRALNAAGLSRAEIARALGIRYQHVRNVLVGDAQAGRGGADQPGSEKDSPSTAPSAGWRGPVPVRLQLGPHGEIVLPQAMYDALGVEPGGALAARFEDGGIRLYTIDEAVRRVQEAIRSILPEGGPSLVDELIAERRLEAQREWADEDDREA